MEYTLIYAGRSYNLPPFTKAVRKEIDRINADNEGGLDIEKKYLGMYQFVRKMIGGEAALELYGTDNLDEIDLNAITISYLGINSAYDKPVAEMNRQQSAFDAINNEDRTLITEIIKNAGNIQDLSKSMRQANKTNSTAFIRNHV